MGAFSLAMPAWNLLPCDLRPKVGIHVRGLSQTSVAHLRDLRGLMSKAGPEQSGWGKSVSGLLLLQEEDGRGRRLAWGGGGSTCRNPGPMVSHRP